MRNTSQALRRIEALERIFINPRKYEITFDPDGDPACTKAIQAFRERYPENEEAEKWLAKEILRGILAAFEAEDTEMEAK